MVEVLKRLSPQIFVRNRASPRPGRAKFSRRELQGAFPENAAVTETPGVPEPTRVEFPGPFSFNCQIPRGNFPQKRGPPGRRPRVFSQGEPQTRGVGPFLFPWDPKERPLNSPLVSRFLGTPQNLCSKAFWGTGNPPGTQKFCPGPKKPGALRNVSWTPR